MKELHFIYQMSLLFSEDAERHNFTLKCFPQSDDMQQIHQLRTLLEPECRSFISWDSFGNHTLCGRVEVPHQVFQIIVSGNAVTGLGEGREADLTKLGKYRYPSYYTKPGDSILEYWHSFPAGGSPLEVAEYYTMQLFHKMQYVPGATAFSTKANDAFSLGKGVCQDYAHILISLLRLEHIPCRYVVGMMLGEGASHAWVEVEQDGIWYGFDPTNGRRVDDNYIFISCGRDALDCQMNKGIMIGGGMQRQSVSVLVTERNPFAL